MQSRRTCSLLPYWLLFVLWMMAAFAYNRLPRLADGAVVAPARRSIATYALVTLTILMVGMRFEVGGDWQPYLDNYNQVQLLSYTQALDTFEVGYATLVYLAASMDTGIWFSNLGCGLLMVLGIARFCQRQPNPALSFLVAVPYLVIVVGMGYTRQGVAIGLIMAGLADADGRHTGRLILYVLAAALFHRTALLVLPLVLAPLLRRNLLYALGGALAFAVLFYLLLARSTDLLVAGYVSADYESSGATVRVAMNLLPAAVALLFRRRLGFDAYQSDVWSVFALMSLVALGLVLYADFSTAIDRVALFLIPLQVAILPRVPYMFGRATEANAQWVLAVCGYSAAVQLVWLVFATHSQFWVPYKAYFLNI